jgi:hypothetical protein
MPEKTYFPLAGTPFLTHRFFGGAQIFDSPGLP